MFVKSWIKMDGIDLLIHLTNIKTRKLRGFETAIEDFLESKDATLESFQTHFT